MRTRVGYTGGKTKNPTYTRLGDHTETVQLDFDPSRITYKNLLDVYWSCTNSCARSGTRQYMSAIFYHNEEQKKLALESRANESAKRKQKVLTPIHAASTFYLAEDYHQKYYLTQNEQLMKEFSAMFPSIKAFVNSTAAARVNGFVAGGGDYDTLEKEISSYGLSDSSAKNLLSLRKPRGK